MTVNDVGEEDEEEEDDSMLTSIARYRSHLSSTDFAL
jgi:hypothetical protein